jgi:hypothetical protein
VKDKTGYVPTGGKDGSIALATAATSSKNIISEEARGSIDGKLCSRYNIRNLSSFSVTVCLPLAHNSVLHAGRVDIKCLGLWFT